MIKNKRIYAAAIAVGAFSGMICIAFRYIVAQITSLRPVLFDHKNTIFSHLGVFASIYTALLITRLLLKHFPKIAGSGLPQTQALMLGRRVYNKPFTYLVVKFIGGILSLSSGLSLGREGTSVQMGSLTGYIAGNIMHIKEGWRRHLIGAGAGAGVAAAFTAPLSASILIIESLQKVTISTTLICTLLAGAVAGLIAKFVTPYNIYDVIPVTEPDVDLWILVLIYIGMGIFFALVGKLFSNMLIKGKDLYSDIRSRFITKKRITGILAEVFILASVTWLMGFVFTDMIGGDQSFLVKESTINTFLKSDIADSRLLTSTVNLVILFLVTTAIWAFTVLSHSSGYPGGIFLPMMTVGGLLGKLFYDAILLFWSNGILATDLSGYFILLGMSSVFIAVMGTPITGFILISEMTGHYETFFPALITGTAVYFFAQILKIRPLNEMLYEYIISQDASQPARTILYLDIERNSYFNGKRIDGIGLPSDCFIIDITREGKKIPTIPSTVVKEGDQVGIDLNSKDIEELYRSFISLGC